MFSLFNYFGGVVANFQLYCDKLWFSRFPAISATGTASEISFKSSSVSFTIRDPMLFSKFFTLVVPMVSNKYKHVKILGTININDFFDSNYQYQG